MFKGNTHMSHSHPDLPVESGAAFDDFSGVLKEPNAASEEPRH